jgi:two-component system sensor histidine kinase PilS (NtrC family)
MVQDILQLNRKDRGNPEPLLLANYLAGFADEFCQVEKVPRATLTVESEAPVSLFFDRYHLHQVLWNLCRNAYRHGSKQAGSVRLVASRGLAESVVQLDVIDDGPGVAPEDQAHLFEPFFTTESTGTGLGLYIARQLCEANQASLDYIEVAPGGQFRICGKGEPS